MNRFLFCAVCLVVACSSESATTTPDTATGANADAGASADAAANDGATSADAAASGDTAAPPVDGFKLTSPAFVDGGTLPAEFTCDGVGHSPALAWSGAPAGTQGFALLMTTLAKDGQKWNWVLYNLPASTTSVAVGQTNVGSFGLTSDGPNLAYYPPCSQGPGAKTYTFTVFALSGAPTLPAQAKSVTGAVLTEAMKPLTLGSASLSVSYTRPNQ